MIKYPEKLKARATIGITATSSGVTGFFSKKLDNSINQLSELGYEFIETKSVRNQNKLTSASSEIRAKEFTSLYLNEDIDIIIPPWGGEFLIDMLPYLNFEILKKTKPKWILGFSDTSLLLFVLTVNLNIATAHGPNLLDFGSTPIHKSVLDIFKVLQKKESLQNSLKYHQNKWVEIKENVFSPYNLTEKTEWKILGSETEIEMEGRLIGGNLDTICKIIGTPYATVENFINKYKEEGFIWFFESCDMNSSDIYRSLLQMKMNGWFKYCKGFMYGRADGYSDVSDFTILDALEYSLSDLNIPIIYDIDLGHCPPQLTFINGAYANIKVLNKRGEIIQKMI